MKKRPDFLQNSLIIGAHPDDELLWFNSIMHQADQVVIVFREFWANPDLSERRKAAIAEIPHPRVTCLEISEPGSYGCADWSQPVIDEFGITFRQAAALRDARQQVKRVINKMVPEDMPVAPGPIRELYEANYARIRDALLPMLRPDMNVFSHNPWGEYGHEDHVQVFRVLDALRDEIGFRLWMSNYCTERALPLATRYFRQAPGAYIRLPTDKAYAEEVAGVYKRHDCWTWADDWAWFDEECFMEAPRTMERAGPHSHLMPLNLFRIDEDAPPSWFRLATTLTATTGVGYLIAEMT